MRRDPKSLFHASRGLAQLVYQLGIVVRNVVMLVAGFPRQEQANGILVYVRATRKS